jgi:hypothetical protein
VLEGGGVKGIAAAFLDGDDNHPVVDFAEYLRRFRS